MAGFSPKEAKDEADNFSNDELTQKLEELRQKQETDPSRTNQVHITILQREARERGIEPDQTKALKQESGAIQPTAAPLEKQTPAERGNDGLNIVIDRQDGISIFDKSYEHKITSENNGPEQETITITVSKDLPPEQVEAYVKKVMQDIAEAKANPEPTPEPHNFEGDDFFDNNDDFFEENDDEVNLDEFEENWDNDVDNFLGAAPEESANDDTWEQKFSPVTLAALDGKIQPDFANAVGADPNKPNVSQDLDQTFKNDQVKFGIS